MLAFLFISNDVGYTCCMMHVFRREEGGAVYGGDRHGDAISTDQKLFTFRTIYKKIVFKVLSLLVRRLHMIGTGDRRRA